MHLDWSFWFRNFRTKFTSLASMQPARIGGRATYRDNGETSKYVWLLVYVSKTSSARPDPQAQPEPNGFWLTHEP
jgi:hypothetical protein